MARPNVLTKNIFMIPAFGTGGHRLLRRTLVLSVHDSAKKDPMLKNIGVETKTTSP
jgi:hypothetical protein